MTEAQLQAAVIALAKALGYMVYHTHDSRKSEPGFPDLVLACGWRHRKLVRELKVGDNEPTEDQEMWLFVLQECGDDTGVWTDEDWHSGRIEEELK